MILFDLDGTLVDSRPGIESSVRAAAARAGVPGPSGEQVGDFTCRAMGTVSQPALRHDRAADARTHRHEQHRIAPAGGPGPQFAHRHGTNVVVDRDRKSGA